MVTSLVEFMCNNVMYRQFDNEAMGSLLCPALANIYVDHYEDKLFKKVSKSMMSYRYINDTFTVSKIEEECNKFLTYINSLNRSFGLLLKTRVIVPYDIWT